MMKKLFMTISCLVVVGVRADEPTKVVPIESAAASPEVMKYQQSCGPRCLYFGYKLFDKGSFTLQDMIDSTSLGDSGTSMFNMLQTARDVGFDDAKAVGFLLDDVPVGQVVILFMPGRDDENHGHFVVIVVGEKGVLFIDPPRGKRYVVKERLQQRRFDGILLDCLSKDVVEKFADHKDWSCKKSKHATTRPSSVFEEKLK